MAATPTAPAATTSAHVKRLATARARAALQRAQLHELQGDDGRPEYVLTRGPLTKSLRDLDAVEALLSRMEGTPS